MEEYWQHTRPDPYAGREAARFAQYVRDQRLPVPHLDEVLAYEVASMHAVATGTAVQVPFSCDPRSIINPLRAGRRPGVIADGRYELTVTHSKWKSRVGTYSELSMPPKRKSAG